MKKQDVNKQAPTILIDYYQVPNEIWIRYWNYLTNPNNDKTRKEFEIFLKYLFKFKYFDDLEPSLVDKTSLLLNQMEREFLDSLKLNKRIIYKLNSNILSTFTRRFYEQYEALLQKFIALKLEGDIALGSIKLFHHIIFRNSALRNSTNILSFDNVHNYVKQEIRFLTMFLYKYNYKNLPNKRYDETIFNKVSEYYEQGSSQNKACQKALEYFKLDINKCDSLLKMWTAYRNRK